MHVCMMQNQLDKLRRHRNGILLGSNIAPRGIQLLFPLFKNLFIYNNHKETWNLVTSFHMISIAPQCNANT